MATTQAVLDGIERFDGLLVVLTTKNPHDAGLQTDSLRPAQGQGIEPFRFLPAVRGVDA
tara:strand:- start:144 stop:320 length:177 start_codon:yes stop_codon:yes gene_type:complete